MRNHFTLAAVTAAAMLPAATDALQAGPLARAALSACGGDVARLCSGVIPGGGRIAQCLSDHRGDLSPSCRNFVEQTEDARFVILACTADASRLCNGVLPGGGRIVACLRARSAEVSPTCRDGLNRGSAVLDR